MINKKYKYVGMLPNNGKIEDALNNVPTPVSIVFNSRDIPNHVNVEYDRDMIVPPRVVQTQVNTIILDNRVKYRK